MCKLIDLDKISPTLRYVSLFSGDLYFIASILSLGISLIHDYFDDLCVPFPFSLPRTELNSFEMQSRICVVCC